MKLKYFYSLMSALFITATANGQDFHLSQYDAAALNFNPAMTGMFKGKYRFHGHYRSQWQAVATKPFTTGLFAFDTPVNKKLSLGGQVANFRAGAGNFNVFSAFFSAATDLRLDKNNNHHLSIGLQVGAFQKSFDPNRLTFEAQYSPFNGGGFDASISNGESFVRESLIVPDLNAGLLYYYGKQSARINPFIGGSFFHLNQPKESFFSQDNRLPLRWVAHSGVKFNVSEHIQLLGKAMFMGQENARELTYSLHMHYYLSSSDAYLIFGPTIRNKDAAIMEAGVRMSNFIFRMSYDLNTSSLRPTSNGRGGVEMSLTYIINKVDPNPIQSCPRI
jgi:type IX secretion system PorP/SprF family membrane protein